MNSFIATIITFFRKIFEYFGRLFGKKKRLPVPKKIKTLEMMPEEIKVLYTKILAAQAMADQRMHPKEFSDLYVFMSQIGLSPAARDEVRNSLVSEDVNILELTDLLLSKVAQEEQEIIKFSIVKDLIRVARMDGIVADEEEACIRKVAGHVYKDQQHAAEVIAFAEETIEYDEKLLKNELTTEEFKKGAKSLAATASGIGVPITAVYFSGSVIGLSAAGIIAGLTELGLGGILGLSSLTTGIGIVIIVGIITFKLVKWVLGGKERKMQRMREMMIQEVIALNQRAMVALAEDLNSLASKTETLASRSEGNRQMLEKLKALYQNALSTLHEREDTYSTNFEIARDQQ